MKHCRARLDGFVHGVGTSKYIQRIAYGELDSHGGNIGFR